MPLGAQGTPTQPLIDYRGLYGSYNELLADVLTLFSFLYLPLLPLILMGLTGNRVLTSLTISFMPGSFMLLLSPSLAVGLWYRWMIMLIIPLSVYAANGLARMLWRLKLKTLRMVGLSSHLLS